MLLTPDVLFDSYRDITPAFLQSQGVTLLLTDLDYTLAPKAVRRPNETLKSWIAELQGAGITVMIVSNNRSGTRVTEFCADLGVTARGVEPWGGRVGVWNHVLHLLQRPCKAACPCKYQKKSGKNTK